MDLNYFLSREFWLPPHLEWPPKNVENFPVVSDIFIYPVFTAIGLYILRRVLESTVARPIGAYLGIKCKSKLKLNDKQTKILEKYFQQCSRPAEAILTQISKEVNQSYDDIKEWFQIKRDNPPNKPSKMDKFTESAWRFAFYFSLFVYGMFVVYDKPYFWETRHCWTGYPYNSLEKEVHLYYMVELGFYLSLIVSQFTDVKRKDFWQMFLHHIVTIGLMLYSFIQNHTRMGALILVLHDCADLWLELAKMGKYASLQKLCDTSFGIFALVWLITRLIIFPFKIIYSTTYEVPVIIGHSPAYGFFNKFLYVLQVLHIIWFYMILKVAYKAIVLGKVEKDDRSESDDDEVSNHEKKA